MLTNALVQFNRAAASQDSLAQKHNYLILLNNLYACRLA